MESCHQGSGCSCGMWCCELLSRLWWGGSSKGETKAFMRYGGPKKWGEGQGWVFLGGSAQRRSGEKQQHELGGGWRPGRAVLVLVLSDNLPLFTSLLLGCLQRFAGLHTRLPFQAGNGILMLEGGCPSAPPSNNGQEGLLRWATCRPGPPESHSGDLWDTRAAAQLNRRPGRDFLEPKFILDSGRCLFPRLPSRSR